MRINSNSSNCHQIDMPLISHKNVKNPKKNTQNTAIMYVKSFDLPLISTVNNLPCELIHLKPDKAYSIGRNYRACEFVYSDCRVSNIHCCLLFNSSKKRVYICDGYGFSFGESGGKVRVSSNGVYVNGEKVVKGAVKELGAGDEVLLVCGGGESCRSGVKIGFLIEKIVFLEEVVDGEVSEICDSSVRLNDECIPRASILLSMCREILYSNNPVSYIRRFVGVGDGVRNIGCKRKRASDFFIFPCSDLEFPLSNILDKDVQNHLCKRESPSDGNGFRCSLESKSHQNVIARPQKDYPLLGCDISNGDDIEQSNTFLDEDAMVPDRSTLLKSYNSIGTDTAKVNFCGDELQPAKRTNKPPEKTGDFQLLSCNETNRKDNKELNEVYEEGAAGSHENIELNTCNGSATHMEKVNCCNDELQHTEGIKEPEEKASIFDGSVVFGSTNFVRQAHIAGCEDFPQAKSKREPIHPPGKKFYLNRLQFMDYSSDTQDVISLPELFYPIESLQRVFIATFTSDIRWFLEYCSVPDDLPVTIACHSTERGWSSSPDKRTAMPYTDFPNVVVVYPPFPEVIAFGQDLSRSGIACHHPKFFILQRENSVRVVITSANLVAKQWLHVTNTVWWQDFPLSDTPNYLSLFTQLSEVDNKDSDCDFAAQLAGYVASLIVDVSSQAHWIPELTKFDFKRAVGYLVASVPGIHSARCPYISDSRFVLVGGNSLPKSLDAKLLGSVEVSVVGLSYLFRTTVDADGSRLKKLAAFLGKCRVNEHGMSEVVLRRVTNIQSDANAVSVLVPNPERHSLQDFVQVGFLPKNIAKWVAPLTDVGLFSFSAHIYPKEVLATALEGSNHKVQLILYVTQGPSFSSMSEIMQPEHVSALSSLLASIQRCFGLWRLQEVLSRYKWPEHLETEFVFGSSSIGAVNAHFLAAFSAASGKKSLKCTDSEESDPDWGCWSTSQELRSPSIRIIFPTIERVKNAACGILASKYLLCFSQKTWQRLRNVGVLHDAVPHPNDRIGLPMHVKVARRRFQSNNKSPFGWVYCGSHNFSAAAWGRPLSSSIEKPAARDRKKPVLGLRLHISNYELGIVFVVHPSNMEADPHQMNMNLDDITLPFVSPAPKYTWRDKPATRQAMWEALSELSTHEREKCETVGVASESLEEEIPVEEDDVVEADVIITRENEDEKIYADKLWSQVDSS